MRASRSKPCSPRFVQWPLDPWQCGVSGHSLPSAHLNTQLFLIRIGPDLRAARLATGRSVRSFGGSDGHNYAVIKPNVVALSDFTWPRTFFIGAEDLPCARIIWRDPDECLLAMSKRDLGHHNGRNAPRVTSSPFSILLAAEPGSDVCGFLPAVLKLCLVDRFPKDEI